MIFWTAISLFSNTSWSSVRHKGHVSKYKTEQYDLLNSHQLVLQNISLFPDTNNTCQTEHITFCNLLVLSTPFPSQTQKKMHQSIKLDTHICWNTASLFPSTSCSCLAQIWHWTWRSSERLPACSSGPSVLRCHKEKAFVCSVLFFLGFVVTAGMFYWIPCSSFSTDPFTTSTLQGKNEMICHALLKRVISHCKYCSVQMQFSTIFQILVSERANDEQ